MRVRDAIARVEVIHSGRVTRRGTACLVGRNLVLTALHVIAERTAIPTFLQGEIRLTFPRYSTRATVVDGKWDAAEDWVLLAFDTPPAANWLRLAVLAPDGHDQWETYGFPDAQPVDGMVCRGTVTNDAGTLDGVPVQQLFCDEAAAGNGMPVSGLSGAPVLVNDFVVGVLRWALLTNQTDPDTGRLLNTSVAGTIYACPASRVAASCPDNFPERLPTVSAHPLATGANGGTGAAFSFMRSAGRLLGTVVISLIVSMLALVLAEITLDWTFDPSEMAIFVLVVLSVAILGKRLRSGR